MGQIVSSFRPSITIVFVGIATDQAMFELLDRIDNFLGRAVTQIPLG